MYAIANCRCMNKRMVLFISNRFWRSLKFYSILDETIWDLHAVTLNVLFLSFFFFLLLLTILLYLMCQLMSVWLNHLPVIPMTLHWCTKAYLICNMQCMSVTCENRGLSCDESNHTQPNQTIPKPYSHS